jgi:spore coat protein U-like protein
MKALNRKILLPLVVTSCFAPAAMAATTTVPVSATVVGTCQFNSSGSVSFTLDPSSAADATGTVSAQPRFWCTNGTSYTISDDFGVNEATPGSAPRRMTDGTNFIPYSFTYTASGTGAGKNSPITMDISATVLNADFVNAVAGTYTDTVTLTITP